MKKVCIIILSLVCCLMLAAGFGGCNDATEPEQKNFLVDKEITVYVGETYKFEPTGAESFTYKSSDENVARVSASGLLVGVSDGTAFIEVSAEEGKEICKVNVAKAENYIRLNANGVSVTEGNDVTVKAEVVFHGKTTGDAVSFSYELTENLTVKSSDENSITLTVNKIGGYVITATFGDMTAECRIKAVTLEAKTLAAPVITVEDCKTVKWNKTENASGYAYSVNGGEWIKTEQTSFDAGDTTEKLLFGDVAVFAVKALSGEDDFGYIDSNPSYSVFSHEYKETVIEEYSCDKVGKSDFKCTVCGKEYTDENRIAEHRFVNGVCTVCGLIRTKKVIYRYDESNDCYFVVGADAGYDEEDLYILAEYNDGTHGSRPVKYIGYGAFQSNTTIKRVILPETMTEFVDADAGFNKTNKNGVMVSSPLRGAAFDNCSNLEYVSMKGVTILRDIADSAYAHWNFRDCYNLKQVIVAEGFDNYGATFMRWVNTPAGAENQTDLYVYGTSITKFCSDSYPMTNRIDPGNNRLLTGDVFYYDENSDLCYKWHFAEDGETIITAGKHVFNGKNRCKKCGAANGFGINYGYYEGKDPDGKEVKTYYVSDNQSILKSEVVVLGEYTDGIHGVLPVTFVKNEAFARNASITKVILPKSVTRLDGGVFLGCENLEYVAMPGISELVYVNLSNKMFYGDGVTTDNNFIECYRLKAVEVNEKFNLYANPDNQQFLGINKPKNPILDIYSAGAADESVITAQPNAKNNLLSGRIYYKGSLDICGNWSDEDGVIETSAPEHDFYNGVCRICGARDAKGVIYQYNAKKGVYFVAGYGGTNESVTVFDSWNDGKNGEKSVKYVEKEAFKGNATIKRVILPESVDSLEGTVFLDCVNLEYVSMTGVSEMNWASKYNGKDGDNNFLNCTKLKTVVVKSGLTSNCQQFLAINAPNAPVLDFFVYGGNAAPNLTGNNNLQSGNVYYYSATRNAGFWHYEANGLAALWN